MRRGIKAALFALFCLPVAAETNRVVILKIDGLPPRALEEHRLPNIEKVFRENGTTLENFYVRGLSLSAPSWSLLDTGRPLEIRGNVEYDRYTLRPYDYLNFVPFYFSAATAGRVDMRGVDRFGLRERVALSRPAALGVEVPEATRGAGVQRTGPALTLDQEAVRTPGRQVHKPAWPETPDLVSALEADLALKHVERLVGVVVDMPRRAEARWEDELGDFESATGLLGGELPNSQEVERPEGVPLLCRERAEP